MELVRFFDTMARRLNGQGEDGKVSLQTIKNGHVHMLEWCKFNYDGWHLNSSERVRIQSLFQELLAEGIVIGAGPETKAWVTSDMTCKLITSLLSTAVTFGTPDWDSTIMYALTVLLLSATGARAGDIAQSQFRDVAATHQGFERRAEMTTWRAF
ncbi:hypothetical protein BGZ61DRAFT_536278 [Ilyonectria robusta]|uniref:uncharacterized protein n=1 Tax=Ilyonectria robusta TaxID=1079257 RepID=UPI001E8EBA7B|nr:uncharacterized protein BGZ61DRAFT_536278 [Ilyonectria robusta]KAH8674974.1 hypothetical protein BGZ61DRAFT_536278 [Ilyonectria robusta]